MRENTSLFFIHFSYFQSVCSHLCASVRRCVCVRVINVSFATSECVNVRPCVRIGATVDMWQNVNWQRERKMSKVDKIVAKKWTKYHLSIDNVDFLTKIEWTINALFPHMRMHQTKIEILINFARHQALSLRQFSAIHLSICIHNTKTKKFAFNRLLLFVHFVYSDRRWK